MKPKSALISFYIIVVFLLAFSCQRKNSSTKEASNNKSKIEKLLVTADNFYTEKKLDSAFYYYNEIKFICVHESDPETHSEKYVYTLNRMADIQQSQADYIGSTSTLNRALPLLKNVKQINNIWNTYTGLGINYMSIYDYKNAWYYFNKALILKTTKFKKLETKNSLALVLLEQHKYEKALKIFLSLITENDIKNNPAKYAEVLNNIGYSYYKTKDEWAFTYTEDALEISKNTNNILNMGKSYALLSQLYQDNNPGLGKKYALLSYQKFSAINNVDDRLFSLKLLINGSENQELKKYTITYIELVDSIFEVRQKAKNQFAKIKYNFKKDKNENLILKTHKAKNELQLEKQKIRNIILYIIILLGLCLILVLYFFLTSRANREKIEATYKSETRIAKKLHDELANDIYHTMAFTENKDLLLPENKQHLLLKLDAIYSRTRDISKENNQVVTDENFTFYLKEMISGFNTPDINIMLNGLDTISWNLTAGRKKTVIYRVLQELLVNMKKHSHATLAGINFKESEKEILIHYTDNGKGVDIQNISFKNGLYNVDNQISAIKGDIKLDSASGKGFKASIKIPL